MKKIILIKLAISFLGLSFFNNANAFEMYIHTGYKGTPDFSKYGFSQSEIIYEQQIYRGGEDRGDIAPLHIEKIASIIKSKQSNIIILDIEYWMKDWRRTGYRKKLQVMNRYVNTVNELHSIFPTHQFGYYGVVPAWPHWNIGISQRLFETWQQENEIRKIVGGAVDVFYPSLYTYNLNPEDWKARASTAISKARQMANGKKVIAFIWPGYHQSSKARKQGLKRLPAQYWRIQLEHMKNIADGVVIWDGALGSNGTWDETMPWWVETKKFLMEHFPEKQLISSK